MSRKVTVIASLYLSAPIEVEFSEDGTTQLTFGQLQAPLRNTSSSYLVDYADGVTEQEKQMAAYTALQLLLDVMTRQVKKEVEETGGKIEAQGPVPVSGAQA